MEKSLVNRVASSGLITINLEHYYPTKEIVEFDIKPFLYKELLLKEKDFRQYIDDWNWEVYQSKVLCVYCSSDAIVPVWAYMLIASKLDDNTGVHLGKKEQFLEYYYKNFLNQLELSQFEGQRIVIKGCSQKPVPASAYLELTKLLVPIAKSIMYGEPCSTVPIYKKK